MSKFFRFFLIIIFVFLLIGGAFAALYFKSLKNYSDSDRLFGNDFFVLVQTDNAYKNLSYLLDLNVTEKLLDAEPLREYKESILAIKSSPLRENKYVELVASSKAQCGVYNEENGDVNVLVTLDLGIFSPLAQYSHFFMPLLTKVLKIDGLSLEKSSNTFVYTIKGEEKDTSVYIKSLNNLAIVSLDQQFLNSRLSFDSVTEDENLDDIHSALKKKMQNPFRILFNAGAFIPQLGVVSKKSYSVVDFSIDEDELTIKSNIALDTDIVSTSSLASIFGKRASNSSFVNKLTDNTEFSFLINSGSLKELKEALFPLLPESVGAESLWDQANKYTNKFFKLSIEDILYSWTGKEFSVIRIKNSSVPVYCIQIGDEAKRKKVFDSITNSILIRTNESLIVDGVRLPFFELPSFFSGVLKFFKKMELPKYYFLADEGYMYFSQSAQNLSLLYNKRKSKEVLYNKNNGFSNKMNASVYLDSQNGIPSFAQSVPLLAKLLEHYNCTRCDINFEDDFALLDIQCESKKDKLENLVEGFPIKLDGESDYKLEREFIKSDYLNNGIGSVFWMEDDKIIKSLDLHSMVKNRLAMSEECAIKSCEDVMANDGVLWVASKSGYVYLLDKNLNVIGKPVNVNTELPKSKISLSCDGATLVISFGKNNVITVDESMKVNSFRKTEVNAQNNGFYFSDGKLVKVTDSQEISVRLDSLERADKHYVYEDNGYVFVSGSSSEYLYAFNDDLELLSGFPVIGRGKCVMMDIDNDGRYECICLSPEGCLYAWKL